MAGRRAGTGPGDLKHVVMAEFQKHEECLPFLPQAMTGFFIRELSWLTWMEDDGIVSTGVEYCIEESVIDTATLI